MAALAQSMHGAGKEMYFSEVLPNLADAEIVRSASIRCLGIIRSSKSTRKPITACPGTPSAKTSGP